MSELNPNFTVYVDKYMPDFNSDLCLPIETSKESNIILKLFEDAEEKKWGKLLSFSSNLSLGIVSVKFKCNLMDDFHLLFDELVMLDDYNIVCQSVDIDGDVLKREYIFCKHNYEGNRRS